nr:hypothetical protein BaRGS_000376 [Batillaria attramentaria]
MAADGPGRGRTGTGEPGVQPVRKGVGACIFVLGIPCLIAGLIFTIVSSTDDGDEESGRKYPTAFPVVGPILLVLSVLCFGIGVLLHNIAILVAIRDCLNLSEPGSFCRVHFPKLSAWLRPDPTVARNRAALNNLQTAPARSAMRKACNPDLVAVETETLEAQGHLHGSNPNSKRKRGRSTGRKGQGQGQGKVEKGKQ